MRPRPPRATRTYTLFPDTARFRSPSSIRPAPRRARPTRCSTTPRCASVASRCSRTTETAWSGCSRSWRRDRPHGGWCALPVGTVGEPGWHTSPHEDGARMSKIAVIRTGYVGLTTGPCFAPLGHDVVCADHDAGQVERPHLGPIPNLAAEIGTAPRRARGSQYV